MRTQTHAPAAVLHDQVDARRGVQHIEEADDVGVAVPLQNVDLARHAAHVGGALDLVLLQDLDRHLCACIVISASAVWPLCVRGEMERVCRDVSILTHTRTRPVPSPPSARGCPAPPSRTSRHPASALGSTAPAGAAALAAAAALVVAAAAAGTPAAVAAAAAVAVAVAAVAAAGAAGRPFWPRSPLAGPHAAAAAAAAHLCTQHSNQPPPLPPPPPAPTCSTLSGGKGGAC